MNKRTLLIIGFALMVIAQLVVPGKMIFDSETVIQEGKLWRFRTAPRDPNDPFRGKYITLRFADTQPLNGDSRLERGDIAYVTLQEDEDGFAIPMEAYSYQPDTEDYVKVTVSGSSSEFGEPVWISYPFDRYYMEESKALPAEKIFRKSQRDRNSIAWAEVSIKDGDPILQDVLIDGVPIKEMVEVERATEAVVELVEEDPDLDEIEVVEELEPVPPPPVMEIEEEEEEDIELEPEE